MLNSDQKWLDNSRWGQMVSFIAECLENIYTYGFSFFCFVLANDMPTIGTLRCPAIGKTKQIQCYFIQC